VRSLAEVSTLYCDRSASGSDGAIAGEALAGWAVGWVWAWRCLECRMPKLRYSELAKVLSL
jgi:hypothetical protein